MGEQNTNGKKSNRKKGKEATKCGMRCVYSRAQLLYYSNVMKLNRCNNKSKTERKIFNKTK